MKKIDKLNKNGIFYLRQGYYKFSACKSKNKVFFGYFESAKYFYNIRNELLEEFTPKEEPLEKNKKIYDEIKNTNSVCVSIRRGDYLSNNFKKDFYICTPEYFNKAIEIAKYKIQNPKFFVFSDDVQWIKENMNFPEGTIFEDGNDPVYEKIRMMYSCKNFIISNSTFSWWAQYLSRNNNKVVIAPSKWRNTGYYKDIYQDKWIKVDI